MFAFFNIGTMVDTKTEESVIGYRRYFNSLNYSMHACIVDVNIDISMSGHRNIEWAGSDRQSMDSASYKICGKSREQGKMM